MGVKNRFTIQLALAKFRNMKYRLGDICTITKGETGIMKAIPGEYIMVALGEANKTHNEFQFDTKAVIIPLVSSTGHGHASMKRVKYQEGKFALGNILCAVIPKDENFVLAKYLHIYLHWNREELLVSQMKGMANVSLSIGKIAEVIVIVPNLEKQRQIVELEQKLVAKELIVEKLLTDQLTQLENLNQAILQEAVQGKLVKQNPKDEPASELLKRIKAEKAKSGKREKPLPPIKPEEIPFEIPESWVWCRLSDIADVGTGATPLTSNPEFYLGGSIPWITSAATNELFVNSCESFITEKALKETNCQVYPIGTLIVAMYGQGKTRGQITELKIAAATNQACASISFLIDEPCLKNYVKIFFQENYLEIRKLAQGGAQPNLNLGKVKDTLIPLPPLSEQTRIVAEIEKQLAKTKQLREHIIANQHATEQLLKALLHGAFEVEEKEEVNN
jgi:type I restriction enzyme, S subunit